MIRFIKAFLISLAIGFPVVGVIAGAVYFVRSDFLKRAEPQIIAVIGLGECDKWMGAIVVTSDGKVHGSNTMTAEQAAALAQPLPNDHSTLAMAPCAKEGIGT